MIYRDLPREGLRGGEVYVKRSGRQVLCFLALLEIFCAAGKRAPAENDTTGEYTLGEVVLGEKG